MPTENVDSQSSPDASSSNGPASPSQSNSLLQASKQKLSGLVRAAFGVKWNWFFRHAVFPIFPPSAAVVLAAFIAWCTGLIDAQRAKNEANEATLELRAERLDGEIAELTNDRDRISAERDQLQASLRQSVAEKHAIETIANNQHVALDVELPEMEYRLQANSNEIRYVSGPGRGRRSKVWTMRLITPTPDWREIDQVFYELKYLPRFSEIAITMFDCDTDAYQLIAQAPLSGSLSLERTELTDARAEQLPVFKYVTALSLHYQPLTTPPHASKFPRLTILDVSNCNISDDGCESLVSMKDQLVELNISENPISDVGLKKLATFKRLKWLSLAETKCTTAGCESLLEEFNRSGLFEAERFDDYQFPGERFFLEVSRSLVSDAELKSWKEKWPQITVYIVPDQEHFDSPFWRNFGPTSDHVVPQRSR